MKRRDARRQALELLYEAEIRERSVEKTLVGAGDVDEYARRIAEGVADSISAVDGLIERHALNWDLDRMPAVDRSILRIATWEMNSTDLNHAIAIDEAIELAKEYCGSDSASFVNGVLAAISSELQTSPRGSSGSAT